MMTEDERLLFLDKTDLTILSTLAKNSRTSFSSIGLNVGLTSKSVKARVKKMMLFGVIERFVIRVNPAIFGFKIAIVLIKTGNGVTKDDVIKRFKHIGNLAYNVHHMGRTCVAALIIEKSLDNNFVQSLNQCLEPATVVSIFILERNIGSINLSETDLRIIRCLLLSGSRTEIADIAREVGISEKTATRRLNSMKEAKVLDFSIQCNPSVMTGYIQFAIPITTTRFHRRKILERMYLEFQANILYTPSIIDSEDRLTFVLFGENVFMVDSVLAKVISFDGVKTADVYILTKWQYHDDWIIKEISNRISGRRSLLNGPPIKIEKATD